MWKKRGSLTIFVGRGGVLWKQRCLLSPLLQIIRMVRKVNSLNRSHDLVRMFLGRPHSLPPET